MKAEVGGRYLIRHRNDRQKYDRTTVATYLGDRRDSGGVYLCFDQRPIAGTVEIPLAWIKDIRQVPDSTPIHVNRRVD